MVETVNAPPDFSIAAIQTGVVVVDEPALRLDRGDAVEAVRRLVGQPVIAARATLRFGPGPTCEPLARVLDRAVEQAHQVGQDPAQLIVADARIDAGEDFVRVRRTGYGTADWIRSSSCRVRVALAAPGDPVPELADATPGPPAAVATPRDTAVGLDVRAQAVREALLDVIDPDLGVNVVDLGFVRDITIRGSALTLTMTLTSPACPLRENLQAQVREALAPLSDVASAEVEWRWSPAWHPSDISAEGREQLRALGFSI